MRTTASPTAILCNILPPAEVGLKPLNPTPTLWDSQIAGASCVPKHWYFYEFMTRIFPERRQILIELFKKIRNSKKSGRVEEMARYCSSLVEECLSNRS
jgi:hypothetical protein